VDIPALALQGRFQSRAGYLTSKARNNPETTTSRITQPIISNVALKAARITCRGVLVVGVWTTWGLSGAPATLRAL
jgi:hypothetical protein